MSACMSYATHPVICHTPRPMPHPLSYATPLVLYTHILWCSLISTVHVCAEIIKCKVKFVKTKLCSFQKCYYSLLDTSSGQNIVSAGCGWKCRCTSTEISIPVVPADHRNVSLPTGLAAELSVKANRIKTSYM